MKVFLFATILLGLTSYGFAQTASNPYGVAAYTGEIRCTTSDGGSHYNIPAVITALNKIHVTTYYYLIYHSKWDWSDLQTAPAATGTCPATTGGFLAQAKANGINVVVYLVPPSECTYNTTTPACLYPDGNNYPAWATDIATLSNSNSNLIGWSMDDFVTNLAAKFTLAYTQSMQSNAKAVNPNLKFYPIVYYNDLYSYSTGALTGTLNTYMTGANAIDGVILPYRDDATTNTEVNDSLPSQIAKFNAALQPYGKPMVLMIYGTTMSGTSLAPTPAYLWNSLRTGLPYLRNGQIAGIVMYNVVLSASGAPNYFHNSDNGVAQLGTSQGVHTGPAASSESQLNTVATVNPTAPSYSITFYENDAVNNTTYPVGYRSTNLLVNGTVVWTQDIHSAPNNTWTQQSVTIPSNLMAGKTTATIAFQEAESPAGGNVNSTIEIADLVTTGFTVADPNFLNPWAWGVERSVGTAQSNFTPTVVVRDANWYADTASVVQEAYGADALVLRAAGQPAPLPAYANTLLTDWLAGNHSAAASDASLLSAAATTAGNATLAAQATLVANDLSNEPYACAADQTSLFTVTRGGYAYNVGLQRFVQQVTLTANSTVTGPFYFVLDGLSSNATLYNQRMYPLGGGYGNPPATTECTAPTGSAFAIAAPAPAQLTSGQSITLTLQFTDPTKAGFSYTPRVLAGPGLL